MQMNICLASNDCYAPHAAALIVSIMENKLETDELVFYFFSDNLSQSFQDTFEEMGRKWNFSIHFIKMSDEQFKDFPKLLGALTAYFRLAMPRFLSDSIKKMLYLDCDMIVMTSLSSLYATEISDQYGAVVAEAKKVAHLPIGYPYFNSGMILFNLEKYRNDNMEEKAIQFGYEHPDWVRYHDQDFLNYIFQGNVVFLPFKWNMFGRKHLAGLTSIGYDLFPDSLQKMEQAESDPGIIHFLSKPWALKCTNPFRNLYWQYAKKTPFYYRVWLRYNMLKLKPLMKSLRQSIVQMRFGRNKTYFRFLGITVIDFSKKTQ